LEEAAETREEGFCLAFFSASKAAFDIAVWNSHQPPDEILEPVEVAGFILGGRYRLRRHKRF